MVSASLDHAASATSTPEPVSAPEMISQMADVAGAMFSLLLLRTTGTPVDEGILLPAAAPSADPPAVLVAPVEPFQESALPVPVPVVDTDHPPAPAIASIAMPASLPVLETDHPPAPAIASIAMPASLPVLDYVPEPGAPLPAAECAIPVTTSAPPHNMAMLSEIGFLDD